LRFSDSEYLPMGNLTIANNRSKAVLVLLVFVIALFAGVILQRAWLGDDAFITFRTVDNALNGYKFTWNTDEKVQVYTHPLWMLMLTVFTFFFHNIYLVSIILSLFISLAAAGMLVFKLARSVLGGGLAVLILALSNAYVDYSTSGLENSLTHLILVVFSGFISACQQESSAFFSCRWSVRWGF
jgi:arabinofuranosyltransferase